MKSKAAALVIAMAVASLVTVSFGYAASEGKGTGDKKAGASQELCPATPGAGVCTVSGGCCSAQAPGKTGQAATESSPAKPSVKAKKEPKKSD